MSVLTRSLLLFRYWRLFIAAMLLAPLPSRADQPLLPQASCRAAVIRNAGADSGAVSKNAGADSSAASRSAGADSGAASPSPRVASRYHPPSAALIDSLKHGGFILVFRHGKTDWGQRDAAVLNFADRSAQRNLNEVGRKEAVEVGKAFAALHIPVGQVLASPMWRCRDTAILSFGRADTTFHLFQKGAASRAVRLRLLSTPPPHGTNTVLVTHQDVLLPIMALQREELGEGEALILRPLGSDRFEILAQASPADWMRHLPSRKL